MYEKREHKTLMKLTAGVNFSNVFMPIFTSFINLSLKFVMPSSYGLHPKSNKTILALKLHIKYWWNWPLANFKSI